MLLHNNNILITSTTRRDDNKYCKPCKGRPFVGLERVLSNTVL